jgi:4-hydroxy-3-methylbut-2-en-1-yl diphosphate reductase
MVDSTATASLEPGRVGRQGRRDRAPLGVKRVIVASPRGYCAGVARAVETVEAALRASGPPVYVRRQIVHNSHVLRDLERRGVRFVESELEVPPGSRLVFSAHGVSPAVRAAALERELVAVDATCPLVAKVHAEARSYASRGYSILLVGHEGHDEVEGTVGEAPDAIVLVQSVEEAERVCPSHPDRIACLTQTTLSVDETGRIIDVLRRRFPAIETPRRDDICYATTNRQRAVKDLVDEVDVLLVLGSRNSSNSNRLVEVARERGVDAYLLDDEGQLDERWLDGVQSVGVTAGASTPDVLVDRLIEWFRARGVGEIHMRAGVTERVAFRQPRLRAEPRAS